LYVFISLRLSLSVYVFSSLCSSFTLSISLSSSSLHVCLSVRMSASLRDCLPVCMSVHVFYLSNYRLSAFLFVYLPISLSASNPFTLLSPCLSVVLYISLSF
jgi:hypothetical protein